MYRNNKLKHLVNVDMIESYIQTHNLSVVEFCEKCNIDLEIYNEIVDRKLNYLPYAISNISELIETPLKFLVNFDLLKDNIDMILKKDN